MKIALVGNPNSGKSTIFSALTGLRQRIANYPGVTVEKAVGFFKEKDKQILLIDLPGIYSLNPYSIDEEIAVEQLKINKPDLIINVIDACNIERHLRLTLDLIDAGYNIVVVLNMFDCAIKSNLDINIDFISDKLKVPVIKTIASSSSGMKELKDFISKYSLNGQSIKQTKIEKFKNNEESKTFIEELFNSSVTKTQKLGKISFTESLDNFLIHRRYGPIFLMLLLFINYQFVFSISDYPIKIFENFFSFLHNYFETYLSESIFKSLVISGLIDSVGGILSFVPLIFFMFLSVSFLEDSGYMTRISFIMDKVFSKFGLNGGSVLSYILGGGLLGGCAVPAIMSTRTIKDKNEKLATILTIPFMNCGAKLPIYALFISAFFLKYKGLMLFILTILSWCVALIMAFILRVTVLKGKSTSFIVEMPEYKLPKLKSILISSTLRTWEYIKKAGTIILLASIIIWSTLNFNFDGLNIKKTNLENSLAGTIGKKIEFISKATNGFNWQMNVSLLAGFAAKEIVVSTLGTIYSSDSTLENNNLSSKISKDPGWTPLLAFSFLIFIMLYVPCVATIAIIKKETGSWFWTLFSVFYTTFVAFLASASVYQLGTLIL